MVAEWHFQWCGEEDWLSAGAGWVSTVPMHSLLSLPACSPPITYQLTSQAETHRCHLCTHLWAYIHICKYTHAHTHKRTHMHTLQPIFIQMNWLFHTCMISILPLDPISMLMKLWIYSINASKHTGVWGAYYNTADEWLHGFYHAIIIVITVIIWPSFGHFSKRATFIPGSISVWSDAGMTRGTAQIDLGRQGRNACQFAIKVHALYLPEPDYLNKAHISHN